MNRDTELALIDEIQELKANKSAFLGETVARSLVERYTSDTLFDKEQDTIFRRVPQIVAHSSELVGEGAFLQKTVAGVPVLVTRDQTGQVNAFLNICRHRGAQLVNEPHGCKHRFSCPYHAWTYANTGKLIAGPHFEQGFPDQDKGELGLIRLPSSERYGFIWVVVSQDASVDPDVHLAGLAEDLAALDIADMAIAQEHSETRYANWKIIVEGGIEAYHFKVAHKHTIGPYFENNLSSYQQYGSHFRSSLPRASLCELPVEQRNSWRLLDHANALYSLFPSSSLLVQQDHVVWITKEPVSARETRLRLVTLVPSGLMEDNERWVRNHAITAATLVEDFDLAESIQRTSDSGANKAIIFGRFESALDQFNRVVDAYVTGGTTSF